jgi:two-component system CheB/CheR fusion protein
MTKSKNPKKSVPAIRRNTPTKAIKGAKTASSAEATVKKVAAPRKASKDSDRLTSAENAPAASNSKQFPQATFPIVGIGASAGGLEAVTQLLNHLPPDAGVGIVVIQHLDPKHESLTSEILSRATSMPVIEAQDGMELQVNRVYVIPPNYYLRIADGILRLSPRTATFGPHLPIDIFFSSLAAEENCHAVGVVLSGTASDGTKGLLAIKAAGGVTFAQEPGSAKYSGMPQSAIAAGVVDFVLTPAGIAAEIARIAHHPYITTADSTTDTERPVENEKYSAQATESTLNRIFTVLRNRAHIDFTHYKRSTIQRRLARRMLVVKSKDMLSYASYLESHTEEANALVAEILIHVTEFFRDADAFEALNIHFLSKYLKGRDPGVPIRVWVAGCSTGEEAYSIAILILEYLEENALHTPLQLFASDISESAIQKARSGLYDDSLQGVSNSRLRRYFEKVSSGYRISKIVRDSCIFSTHDVTRDPPFAKVDLISCRNLLIYFDDELQKRVLPTFHYALNPGGMLFLGKAENISGFTTIFSTVDKIHKIYSKNDVKTPIKVFIPSLRGAPEAHAFASNRQAGSVPMQSDLQKELDRIALKDYAPPSIIINDSMDILQVRGRTAPYLELASGQPSLNLLKMARPELVADIRKLVQAVRTKDVPAKKEGFRILEISGITTFNIKVTPLKPLTKSNERCYAIFFEVTPSSANSQTPPLEHSPKTKGTKAATAREKTELHTLREQQLLEIKQLQATQENLQALNEEYETGQEELTASNEELQSANEELQSTNEEMETAREELQSSNEELTTVNDELQTRNAEMIQLTSDLVNLLASAEIPIALVGADGRIRRFTPQAEKQLKIISGDVGRRIGDLRPDLGEVDLEAIANEVMKTSIAKEIETKDSTGHWYQLNVRPYRKAEGQVDGAVISLIDIHTVKSAQEAARIAEKSLNAARADAFKIIESNPVPLIIIKPDRTIKLANRAFYETFVPASSSSAAAAAAALEGHTIAELGNGQWNIPQLNEVIERTMSEGIEFHNFEIKHAFPQIGIKVMLLNARRIQLPGSGIETVMLAIEDYTERRRSQEDLKDSEEKYRNLVASAYDGVMVVRRDGTIEFANIKLEKMFGYEPGELLNQPYDKLIADRDRPNHEGYHDQYMAIPIQREMGEGLDLVGRRKDGSEFPVDISLSPFTMKSEIFVNCVVRDISRFKDIENERLQLLAREKSSRQEAESANRSKDDFLATLSHELRTPLSAILSWSELISSGKLDAEKTKHGIEVMKQSARAQSQLIDDLLEISRIQAGKLNLSIQKADPEKIISAAIDATRNLAASKSIQIATDIDPAIKQIFADPTRLQQILWNLITNSIKFSPQGGRISIRLNLVTSPSGERIQLQVQDKGKGIKPEFVPIIFERFSQLDSTTTRAYGGLGLGLAIVRKLVEMHEGTVTVESKGEGQGATFTVTLPSRTSATVNSAKAEAEAMAEAEAEAEAKAKVSLHGLKIMVVEDDASSRDVFSVMLQSFGGEVMTADSAKQALALIKEFKPDVLVSDIAMPDEDGYSLIRKIRALKGKLGKTPALALTAYAAREDIERAHLAGFEAHLAKPAEAHKLALAIARLAGKKDFGEGRK